MENQVQVIVEMDREHLEQFKFRFDEINQESPEQFREIQPLKICPSVSYALRVQQIQNTRSLHHGAQHPQTQRNRASINDKLFKQLQSRKPIDRNKKDLPIMPYREQILELIEKNQVILIRGATACGKTTQVPQFILDSFIRAGRGTECRIACTQPRRVAAITIAERVANERKEKLGGGSVGYLIRCENEMPRQEGGHILFCTVGVLLRKLHFDPLFKDFTHIIVDEIHERSTDSDLLLAILKIQILPLRPDLRVIVMSATLEMDQFSVYFNNCPTLQIIGFNHQVQEVYLDEIKRQINFPMNKRDMKNYRIWSQFIAKLIVDIHTKQPPGAILVFCSGYDDIEQLEFKLKATKDKTMKVYVLHSLVPLRKNRIFSKPSEKGDRKIVLSTNVAESSITIEDVVYVVDNGKCKVMSYNAKEAMYALNNSMITKANAMQRKGRAGRCQDGIVYRLYEKSTYERMDENIRACIARERLDTVLLKLMLWNFGPADEFLTTLLTPPSVGNITNSLKALHAMDAITEDYSKLTKLGRQLANLNLEPQLGKMLIYASIFNCVDPIASVVAYLSFKDIFLLSLGQKNDKSKQKKKPTKEDDDELADLMRVQLELDGSLHSDSDHMTRAKAIQDYQLNQGRNPDYCREHLLHEGTMAQVMAMRTQIISSLARNHLIERPRNGAQQVHQRTCSDYVHMIRSVICAGLYPNTAALRSTTVKDKNGIEVEEKSPFTPKGRKMEFHKKSVNHLSRGSYDTDYFVYFKAVSTNKVFLHDSTMVHSLALSLFASDVQYQDGFVVVDGSFHFQFHKDLITLIQNLRIAMKNIFNKMINSSRCYKYTAAEDKILQLIADILSMAEI